MNLQKLDVKTIKQLNTQFKEQSLDKPEQVVRWVLKHAKKPVVTTNFRPYESAILYICNVIQKNMPIIWCDTGYNTRQTYLYKIKIEKALQLIIYTYVPKYSTAYLEACMGGIPEVDTPAHKEFTKIIKLDPFNEAMEKHSPDVWFTNIRKGQTTLRNSLDVFSITKQGLLKVSPFYHWDDEKLDMYLEQYSLPNEFKYFDPTKVLENRECGLHG